jgi:hypothetical protein
MVATYALLYSRIRIHAGCYGRSREIDWLQAAIHIATGSNSQTPQKLVGDQASVSLLS